jgi:hypothetical protein
MALIRMRIMAGLALLALTQAGCDGGRPGAAIPTSGAGATWRWRAESMRVSALTTPLPPDGGRDAELDVRVAFFDTDHDETKAIGVLTVVATSAGIQLGRLEVPLGDMRSHAAHWDSVTETYSVRLPLPGRMEPQPGQVLEVRALFEGEDGALMRASRDVRWPQPGASVVRRRPAPGATPPASAVSSAAEREP